MWPAKFFKRQADILDIGYHHLYYLSLTALQFAVSNQMIPYQDKDIMLRLLCTFFGQRAAPKPPIYPSGHKWTQLDTSRAKWAQVETSGHKWSQVDSNGPKWTQVDPSVPKAGPCGSRWTQKDTSGANKI